MNSKPEFKEFLANSLDCLWDLLEDGLLTCLLALLLICLLTS